MGAGGATGGVWGADAENGVPTALVVVTNFNFVEAFVLPLLVEDSPQFVEEFSAIVYDESSYRALSVLFQLDGLLFGIALIRANVLSRPAAIVFTVGAVAALTNAISPVLGRSSAVLLGVGLAWLGYALLTETRDTPATA